MNEQELINALSETIKAQRELIDYLKSELETRKAKDLMPAIPYVSMALHQTPPNHYFQNPPFIFTSHGLPDGAIVSGDNLGLSNNITGYIAPAK